ncbi:MAG TPA: endonuclease domain-containing protein [Cellvibrionaceae bacterium]|nr:endonuclease domain-containing protein [Cellvibrionaceae bacterium]HMW46878.1 endonuclease domain-containing protein [Cellvibrionaceae bacterium]HMW70354.1 endonuclease domain-containing protein [Cellvibrionaceae bacterium]HMY37991.1 endonuclease domain-containing protein [Marinagarivorans sp.]HNG59165.1 endonuclease domain-containing protein [Cellvibrionaceae bacterium]
MRATQRYKSLPYNPALKARARALRRAGNLAEVLLWGQLKNKQLLGLDFDRQKIIGNYIVDFYCAEQDLVIEIDGYSHEHTAQQDTRRDKYLTALGLRVVHLLDSDVKQNLEPVMDFLHHYLNAPPSCEPPRPYGAPLQGRGIPSD